MHGSMSLLWPTKEHYTKNNNKVLSKKNKYPNDYARDLHLEMIAREIYPHNYSYAFGILSDLCDDTEVISYRLDVLDDFLNIPELEYTIQKNMDSVYKYVRFTQTKGSQNSGSFIDLAAKLSGFENYIECINNYNSFSDEHGAKLKSDGLKSVFHIIKNVHKSEEFKIMVKETTELRRKLSEGVSSITIGINLDQCMRPSEAVLLSVGCKPFKERSLLSRIMGQDSDEENKYGIATIHKLGAHPDYDGLDDTLFKDLRFIANEVVQNFTNSLKVYYSLNTSFLVDLDPEFTYYAGAAKMIKNLKSHGLKMCRPIVERNEKRIFKVDGLVDVLFALKLMAENWHIKLENAIVDNDVHMHEEGRVFILTGPNQGGKTTYARAIGTAHALFQAGLYVPGSSANISPVDWIYTHFPKEEKVGFETSRLSEECKHFTNTFNFATRYSLLLLNESISSTSPAECLYLAEEIVKGIRYLGCKTIYATHLHELCAKVDRINKEVEGDGKLVSMVAGVEEGNSNEAGEANMRTYKVVSGVPLGSSYARDIAAKYGVSFEQILQTLKTRDERKVVYK